MLVLKVAVLLCSSVLASTASKIPAHEEYSDVTADFKDVIGAQQYRFGDMIGWNRKEGQKVVHNEAEDQDFPHSPKEADKRTIYQILSDNDKFTRLVKVINISDEIVSLLNDTSAGITFFAPPNHALRRPRHRKHHHTQLSTMSLDDADGVLSAHYSSYELPDLVAEVEDLETSLEDDRDKERRKKIIKIIVRAILAYHVLPQGIDSAQLAENTTFATNLTIPDGALDGEALRIRVQSSKLFPITKVNFFVTVVKANIRAKNGIIHVVNHPLLPPPSIFQELFLFPKVFGGLTSAIQRVGLTDALEWRYVPSGDGDKKWTVQGKGPITVFVPSSSAFKKLPRKLQLFLFSPFGERVLEKLLQYHAVPGIVLHSDYIHNATSADTVKSVEFTHEQADFDYSGENVFSEEMDVSKMFEHDQPTGAHCRGKSGPRGPLRKPKHSSHDCVDHHHSRPPPPPRGRGILSRLRGAFKAPPPPPMEHPEHPHHPPRGGCKGDSRSHPPVRKPHLPHPKPIFAANLTLPTALSNHTLHVHIAKFKHHIPGPIKDAFVTKLFVNHQSVALSDVVARNGAVHIIHKVLDPRPHHPHKKTDESYGGENFEETKEDSWADWEDWLPQWAAAN